MESIDSLMRSLTNEEKIRLCAGQDAWQTLRIDRLGIPSVLMTDGPHGLRKQYDEKDAAAMLVASIPATCFPSAATTACSFDPDLLYEVGRAIGEEARDQQVQMVLGPGVNIKRSPLCGRNFEYFSEDPYLSGVAGAALIEGIQSVGVGACVKHFAANNREYFRMVTSSIVDERALREIYLPAFEYAVQKAKPYAVMSAYNLLNGRYCGESKELLQDILRDEWGFEGLVVSDWGACYSRLHDLQAGVNLEMPYSGAEHTEQLLKQLQNGTLQREIIDKNVRHVLQFVQKCESNKDIPYKCDYEKHHDIARKAAAQSAVLLKNDGLLPLVFEDPEQPVALIGEFAKKPRYQGAGSSNITPNNLENAYDVFVQCGIPFKYAQGYALDEDSDRTQDDLIDEAVHIAKSCGRAVILAGLPTTWEFEGIDRPNMDIPGEQNRLIEKVSEAVPTAVVLCSGSPVEMPWADDVSAILHTYLGGEAGASALAQLLTGAVCPSGKLAESYPFTVQDNPSYRFFANDLHNTEYRESVYVGYRFYEAAQKEVRFAFGFGLSYTTFELLDVHVAQNTVGNVTVQATVHNTGNCAGAEVVQVYTQGEGQLYKQLAGFQKVFLEPDQSARVEIQLAQRAFCFYDRGHWKKQNCAVLVGTSSQDIVASEDISFEDACKAPVYPVASDGNWPNDAFHGLFKEVPQLIKARRPFTLNATLRDLMVAPMGSLIKEVVGRAASAFFGKSTDKVLARIMMRYIDENPFRAMVSLSGGAFSYGVASALLMIANGSYIAGFARLGVELAKIGKRKK